MNDDEQTNKNKNPSFVINDKRQRKVEKIFGDYVDDESEEFDKLNKSDESDTLDRSSESSEHSRIAQPLDGTSSMMSEHHNITQTIVQQGEHPFHDRFVRQGKPLAENETSVVELVQDDIGRKFIRKINKELDAQSAKLEERSFNFLTEARHQYLVEAKGYFQGVVDGNAVSATLREFVVGDNLEEYVKKQFSENGKVPLNKVCLFASQILDALSYVHEKGFVYRDVKPSNTVITSVERLNRSKRDTSEETVEEKVKMIDIDSLGRQKDVVGSSGSTLGVFSEGWQHPYSMTALASQNTDMFAVGTLLYYMITGEKPTIEKREVQGKEEYTFSKENFSLLESKIGTLDTKIKNPAVEGGPELYRAIKRLMSFQEGKNFETAKDARNELRTIKEIIEKGYQHDLDANLFRVYKAPWWQKTLHTIKETSLAAIVGTGGFLFGSAPKIGLSAGVFLALLGYKGCRNHIIEQSENRTVYFAPQIPTEDHIMVRTAASLNDESNNVSALYVALAGKAPNGKPNDVILQKKIEGILGDAKLASERIVLAKQEVGRYESPVHHIVGGGQQIESSWSYDEYEYTHQSCHQSCTTDSKGNTSCSTICITVCDSEDHIFDFNASKMASGTASLIDGLNTFKTMPHKQVPIAKYVTKEIPDTDVLGRKVLDKSKYNVESNEWLNTPLITEYNKFAEPMSISMNGNVKEVILQSHSPRGFEGLDGYPAHYQINVSCGTSKSYRAPAGFITANNVHGLTKGVGDTFSHVADVLQKSPMILENLVKEAERLDALLSKGKKIDADEFMDIADQATYLYKELVPYSTMAPPTRGERIWYPILLGSILFIVPAAIGFGIAASNNRRRRDYYY